MNETEKIKITTRDRVLKAWQDTTELVRNFETYYHEMGEDGEIAELFAEYAKDEGFHASRLFEILHELEG